MEKVIDYNLCPFCKSGDIEGGSIEIDSDYAAQEVSCNECSEEWTEIYKLVSRSFTAEQPKRLNAMQRKQERAARRKVKGATGGGRPRGKRAQG